jgi:hypothetical protein
MLSPPNVRLSLRPPGYLIVHDEIKEILKQAEINVGNFLLNDGEIIRIRRISSGAAAGVAAIIAVLGITGLGHFQLIVGRWPDGSLN